MEEETIMKEEELSKCCGAKKRILIPLQIGGFDRIECSNCGKIFTPRKKVNPNFTKKYGNYGFQIGRIFTNKRKFGFRLWIIKYNIAIEKSILII